MPLRIGFFVPFFPQRSETFVIDQAADFLEAGHDVEIFCLSGARSGRGHPAVAEHGLMDRTRALMSPDRYRRDKVLRAAYRAVRHFPRSLGPLRMVLRPDIGRGMPVATTAAAMGVLSHARRTPLEFDVLQVHFGPMGTVVDALREMGLVQGPMVVSFHGSDASTALRADPDRYAPLFDRAEAFTVNSSFLLDRLAAMGAPRERTVRIPMGVDPDRFVARPAPGGPPRFLTVARLSAEKDVATAVRAMAVLKDRGRIVRYTVLGGGPLRRELMELAESLEVEDRIDFRGPVAHDAVLEALATHHVFVLPGVEAPSGAVEAQGLALVEAQAAGLPVVASAVGGIPETVGEGAGRLVPPGDPEALADALDATLRERPDWDAIGERGRRHVLEEFDRRALSRRLVDLYRTLA